MSDLTPVESAHLEQLLEMGDGYVLDFTNRSFGRFILRTTGKGIYLDKYSSEGTSKANRLRAFWTVEPNSVVAQLTQALVDYWEHVYVSSRTQPLTAKELELLERCRKVVSRLQQTTLGDHIGEASRDDPADGGRASVKSDACPLVNEEHWHAFVCYADDDRDFVSPIVEELTKRGYQLFYAARDNLPGVSITDSIRVAQNNSDYYLLMLSPRLIERYKSGSLVFEELIRMIVGRRVNKTTIVPVWYELSSKEVAKLDPFLSDITAVRPEGKSPAAIAGEVETSFSRNVVDEARATRIALRNVREGRTEAVLRFRPGEVPSVSTAKIAEVVGARAEFLRPAVTAESSIEPMPGRTIMALTRAAVVEAAASGRLTGLESVGNVVGDYLSEALPNLGSTGYSVRSTYRAVAEGRADLHFILRHDKGSSITDQQFWFSLPWPPST